MAAAGCLREGYRLFLLNKTKLWLRWWMEGGTEGFSQTLQNHKGSMRAGDVGELGLSDCAVSLENMLPKSEIRAVYSCLNMARYGIAWGSIGAAMDCYG